MDPDAYRLFARHPGIGADLLAKIPRFEGISAAIRYQEKRYDGTGVPKDGVAGESIPFGARLLKVALDFDHGDTIGLTPKQSLDRMQKQSKWYDPGILEALYQAIVGEAPPAPARKIRISDLQEGMQLATDVFSKDGLLLIAKGQSITPSVLSRLDNYHSNHRVASIVEIVDGETRHAVAQQSAGVPHA